jgi:hypothetical protein
MSFTCCHRRGSSRDIAGIHPVRLGRTRRSKDDIRFLPSWAATRLPIMAVPGLRHARTGERNGVADTRVHVLFNVLSCCPEYHMWGWMGIES